MKCSPPLLATKNLTRCILKLALEIAPTNLFLSLVATLFPFLHIFLGASIALARTFNSSEARAPQFLVPHRRRTLQIFEVRVLLDCVQSLRNLLKIVLHNDTYPFTFKPFLHIRENAVYLPREPLLCH